MAKARHQQMAVTIELERELGDPVMGIDEAGRGPLVGGVYAAAVSVPLALAERLLAGEWSEINDSKKLSERKRERLAETIKATPGCRWAVASASPAEIDELNILNATHLAMRRAADAVGAEHILVDGLPVKTLPQARSVVKGDAKSLLIAAASILAKTSRDADCLRLERLYPGYGFAKHKGYPTAAHLAALARLGPCPEHRMSFGPVKSAADLWYNTGKQQMA
jgi:ribonuclease HII